MIVGLIEADWAPYHILYLFAAIGVICFAITVYYAIGRFFYFAYVRKTIYYALTNQRILISEQGKLTEIDLKTVPIFTLKKRAWGLSTIRFGRHLNLFVGPLKSSRLASDMELGPAFALIEEGEHVIAELNRLRAQTIAHSSANQ